MALLEVTDALPYCFKILLLMQKYCNISGMIDARMGKGGHAIHLFLR